MEKDTVFNVLDKGYVKFIGSWGDDLEPLKAARMSTNNPTGVSEVKDDGLRDYLWRHQHTSPFEFAELILEIKCPIFVAREWMRHRTQSFNEFSQRYSEAIDEYYLPDLDRLMSQSQTNNQGSDAPLDLEDREFIRELMQAEQTTHLNNYMQILDMGLARELARNNMPVSNYTKFRVKANLKNWLHFINLRISDKAQYEIRVYADTIFNQIIKALFPKIADTFEEHTLYAISLSRLEKSIVQDFMRLSFSYSRENPDSSPKDLLDKIISVSAKLGMVLPKLRVKELYEKLGILE